MSLINLIKKAAIDAVKQSSPMEIAYGTVENENPLEINIEQLNENISGDMILLTSNVMNHDVNVEVDDETEESLGSQYNHIHLYQGEKKHVHKKGLKLGEKVLLLRTDGGQMYIVLDRLVSR